MKKAPLGRLNIYVPDVTIRRQVKTAAAKRDISTSEYCLRAITTQLVRDGERQPDGKDGTPAISTQAVARARRFQTSMFRGRLFTVSSAELIREARTKRRAGD